MAVYKNSGDFFDDTQLEKISGLPEWGSDKIKLAKHQIKEILEKRSSMIEEGLNRGQTVYYWVGDVVRRIGFCYSAVERTSTEDDVRPDMALFERADDFRNAIKHRGSRDFFSQVFGVVRALGWGDSLDDVPAPEVNEEGEELPQEQVKPSEQLDRYLRATGVEWGVLTNGHTWRLFHRDTAGMGSKYFEVNLLDALRSTNPDDFKYFWAIFSTAGLAGLAGSSPVAKTLYN